MGARLCDSEGVSLSVHRSRMYLGGLAVAGLHRGGGQRGHLVDRPHSQLVQGTSVRSRSTTVTDECASILISPSNAAEEQHVRRHSGGWLVAGRSVQCPPRASQGPGTRRCVQQSLFHCSPGGGGTGQQASLCRSRMDSGRERAQPHTRTPTHGSGSNATHQLAL
jgi:hypothetical protein